MKITYVSSSTIILENEGFKILMDPWIVDGEYYGSWCHYPELKVNLDLINDCNYIYISHIHPDHFSRKSLNLINKKIPILILNYHAKFLKNNLEQLGFKVIEIEHNKEFIISDKFKLKLFAADNCNPELCGKFFGCSVVENAFQTTQIDSMAVFYNNDKVMLNVNDCPYELAESTLKLIKSQFEIIDLLLVGYAGAGPFPQCFIMDENEKKIKAEEKKLNFLNQGLNYINFINPKFYMPFAGTYTLSGKLSNLNTFRGVPEIDEALTFFQEKNKFSHGFLLNSNETFDLISSKSSSKYISYNQIKKEYINNVLKIRKLDYEEDGYPTFEDIRLLLPMANKRFKDKLKEIDFKSNTFIFISISDLYDVKLSTYLDSDFEIVSNLVYKSFENYVRISTDFRLLFKLLKGPKYAHWNNAEIGSHLTIERKPDNFERGLFHSLYFFHA
jgi:UDP-MurNAc hydroxylase